MVVLFFFLYVLLSVLCVLCFVLLCVLFFFLCVIVAFVLVYELLTTATGWRPNFSSKISYYLIPYVTNYLMTQRLISSVAYLIELSIIN
jgi:hypothetical protein